MDTSVYPASALIRARDLHAAGYTVEEIRSHIETETGRRPSWPTVHTWVRPKKGTQRLAVKNRRRASTSGGRFPRPQVVSREFKAERLRGLRAAGLSPRAIANAMAYDFGDTLTIAQVEHTVRVGRYPRRTAPRATGQLASQPVT